MIRITRSCLRALEIGFFGCEEGKLQKFTEREDLNEESSSVIRYFRYFTGAGKKQNSKYQKKKKKKESNFSKTGIGVSAHTDIGFLTAIPLASVSGLEIVRPDSMQWESVDQSNSRCCQDAREVITTKISRTRRAHNILASVLASSCLHSPSFLLSSFLFIFYLLLSFLLLLFCLSSFRLLLGLESRCCVWRSDVGILIGESNSSCHS